MKIKRVFAVYFSPTQGTKNYVEKIAQRISADYETIDLTRPENRQNSYVFSDSDLVVFGAPVYAGRLPSLEGGILNQIHGNHTPAIFNVSYGNRDYDDALIEEKHICEANGFVGIAAAAWIAPHTFSDEIAAERPDAEDERQINIFVEKVKEVLKSEGQSHKLEVKGNKPYKEPMILPFHPAANECCIACAKCAGSCPVEAIDRGNLRDVEASKCIDCLACVKNCPVHARGMFNPVFQGMVGKLESALTNTRRNPEFFF